MTDELLAAAKALLEYKLAHIRPPGEPWPSDGTGFPEAVERLKAAVEAAAAQETGDR